KAEAVAELRAALEKIPEKYKNILEFKYILGLSDFEIGERFGISESAVRSCLARARRKAYSVMKEEK
ncbi:MAG: sigma-70 family RNA polymerase sigma factor, partial [Oscillospiraceae bacterium]|nr:sigma-70 family RNA polymerase sigma factor [Oscillospiraceae bacterium]